MFDQIDRCYRFNFREALQVIFHWIGYMELHSIFKLLVYSEYFIDLVCIRNMTVKPFLIPYPRQGKCKCCEPDSQSQNTNNILGFIFQEVPPGNFKIMNEHV